MNQTTPAVIATATTMMHTDTTESDRKYVRQMIAARTSTAVIMIHIIGSFVLTVQRYGKKTFRKLNVC